MCARACVLCTPCTGKKKERSQPARRAKLGLLEKHKDYVKRARNWHAKEDRLKALAAKAEMRNPDEFYFKMHSAPAEQSQPLHLLPSCMCGHWVWWHAANTHATPRRANGND
jgi:hypothetical protein